MSEENSGDWVSVAVAMAALGKSERTVQRRCKSGALVARLVSAGDGQQWQIKATSLPTKSGSDSAMVPTGDATSAAIGADKVPPQFTHENEGADKVPTLVPTGADTRVIEILERENSFLKSQLDAQRLHIEAANRATAEAHAALRAALAAMPKALTEGSSKPVEIDGNNGPQVLAPDVNAAPGTGEFRVRDGAMDKVTQNGQDAAGIGTTARDGRGLRGWLLKVLRG